MSVPLGMGCCRHAWQGAGREEEATWRRQGERGKIRGLAGAGVAVVGTERREKLSPHSYSPSKRHLCSGCPWSGDLGAELGTFGAGAEQTCPGGPCAFVMLELFLNTLWHSPGSAASQLALSCLQISPARPIFPLLGLAPVKEPAPGFVCLNPPRAKLWRSVGDPGFGGKQCVDSTRPPPIGDVLPVLTEARIPSHWVRFFPSLPSWTPSLLPLGTSALLRAVTGY